MSGVVGIDVAECPEPEEDAHWTHDNDSHMTDDGHGHLDSGNPQVILNSDQPEGGDDNSIAGSHNFMDGPESEGGGGLAASAAACVKVNSHQSSADGAESESNGKESQQVTSGNESMLSQPKNNELPPIATPISDSEQCEQDLPEDEENVKSLLGEGNSECAGDIAVANSDELTLPGGLAGQGDDDTGLLLEPECDMNNINKVEEHGSSHVSSSQSESDKMTTNSNRDSHDATNTNNEMNNVNNICPAAPTTTTLDSLANPSNKPTTVDREGIMPTFQSSVQAEQSEQDEDLLSVSVSETSSPSHNNVISSSNNSNSLIREHSNSSATVAAHQPSHLPHSSTSSSASPPPNPSTHQSPSTIQSQSQEDSVVTLTHPSTHNVKDNNNATSGHNNDNAAQTHQLSPIHNHNDVSNSNNICPSNLVKSPTKQPVTETNSVASTSTRNQSSTCDRSYSNSEPDQETLSSSSNEQQGQSQCVPLTMTPSDFNSQLADALCRDEDDDLDDIMSQLNAEIMSGPNIKSLKNMSAQNALVDKSKRREVPASNGLMSADLKRLQDHNRQLLEQLRIRDDEIKALSNERDSAKSCPSHNIEDLYLPQIKELEKTIVQQQKELQVTKDKLVSHDAAARQAVTTLQRELKTRVEQVTRLYEEAVKEKDGMVVTFASSESKVMEMKKAVEKAEGKWKEAVRDKENMVAAVRAAKVDKQKAVSSMEQKSSELGSVHREMDKLKEALSSSEYRVKWFQNKLKEEQDTHKETKTNLDKTTAKLKETKEETEIIRRECQTIVKTYQESEEIKSNSLDKELKIKESQLRHQMQEWNDNQQVHEKTKQDLDSLRAEHKNVSEQAVVLKERVQILESNLSDKESNASQSNQLLNKQKADLTELTAKLKDKEALEEDFSRAQEMINCLDKEISELKVTNRDLVKDMEACQQRESKMLGLQSELSRSNAVLRSENTTLNNKVCTQTGELERMKMELQQLDTSVKHLTDQLEEEKKSNSQNLTSLSASVDVKTKESADFKQKWEDEIDAIKTLKRRHASNVKDLTRQLQQAKRRLEMLDGKDSAMGSRSNSNGSLNSMQDGSSSGAAPSQSHGSGSGGNATNSTQEFPVITEQVEIDKHVLIERIVRLQKSHARKNEKLEFLGEHIQQLLAEIKKKTKIIQSYIMREEAGTLSSEDSDANKNLLSRKGGIMASVYSLHQQDGTMTLDLSLQINKKLQAVLEDTLLKNITLKENLDTLGEEIARLSQVNRKLQLHLQDLEKSKSTKRS